MILSRLARISKTSQLSPFSRRDLSTQYGNSLSTEIFENGVAVVTIDQPNSKVNSLGQDISDNFPKIFTDLENDASVKSILLKSNKKGCFVAGADISMLNQLKTRSEAVQVAKNGQAMFQTMENSKKPVIAAMNGATLGGGLELALACHYRLALNIKQTKIGLPEVMLGLLPGAGGTQRLPKLIGLDKAMPLILQGKQLNAVKAKKQGIVHQVVDPLGPGIVTSEEYFNNIALEIAGKFADGTMKVPKAAKKATSTKIIDMVTKFGPARDKFFESQVYSNIYKTTAGVYPAPLKIADVFKNSIGNPEKGYEFEAEGFADLAMSDEAKAMIHLFHGQNHCKKNKYGKPEFEVKKIGVQTIKKRIRPNQTKIRQTTRNLITHN